MRWFKISQLPLVLLGVTLAAVLVRRDTLTITLGVIAGVVWLVWRAYAFYLHRRTGGTKNRLGKLMVECGALIEISRDGTRSAPVSQTREWLADVEAFLSEKLGESYVARFHFDPLPEFDPEFRAVFDAI